MNTTSPLELSGRTVVVIDGEGATPAADAVRACGGEAKTVPGEVAARLILSGDAPVVVFSDSGQAAAVFDAAAMDGRRT